MKLISLTQGYSTQVDDEDFEWLSQYTWRVRIKSNTCYAVTSVKRKELRATYRMHRLIMNAPDGMDVDHKDRNGLNNQRHNLRLCTSQENQWNSASVKGSSSVYKGVSYAKKQQKWKVTIRIDGKNNHLGYFNCEKEAAITYDKSAVVYYGEFAFLNFPNEHLLNNKTL